MDKVLVTGGSGFIALHCIDQLLEKGYVVRTTIRSESRINEIKKAMNQYPNLDQNLEFHICDLLEDSGWDEAVNGCEYVLHVASPFILEVPSDEDVLIRPAVDGTLRVLDACSRNNVKKVVSPFFKNNYLNEEIEKIKNILKNLKKNFKKNNFLKNENKNF